MSLNLAVKKATRILANALGEVAPEVDTSALGKKIKELVVQAASAETVASIEITASDVAPTFNVAADALATAHSMYMSGDKTNALKMVLYSFGSADCQTLMRGILSLNEEAISRAQVNADVNKSVGDFSDLSDIDPDNIAYGNPDGDNDEDQSLESIMDQNDLDEMQPESEISLIDTNDAPDANTAEEDDEIEGIPPGDVGVLASDDAIEGFDEGSQENAEDDPAVEPTIHLDDITPGGQYGGQITPLDFNFDNEETSGQNSLSDGNGIDSTVENKARNEGQYHDEDLPSPMTDPQDDYAFLASIKDPKILASINTLSAENDSNSKKKLKAFINYLRNQGIAA